MAILSRFSIYTFFFVTLSLSFQSDALTLSNYLLPRKPNPACPSGTLILPCNECFGMNSDLSLPVDCPLPPLPYTNQYNGGYGGLAMRGTGPGYTLVTVPFNPPPRTCNCIVRLARSSRLGDIYALKTSYDECKKYGSLCIFPQKHIVFRDHMINRSFSNKS